MSRPLAGGRNPDKHCKAAGLQSFEFNAGVAESLFDSQPRQWSRPSRAIFDPIDRTLGNAGSFTKIGLAPTQHGPAGADLSGEELPLVLYMARRHIYFRVPVHERVFVHGHLPQEHVTKKKIPGGGAAGDRRIHTSIKRSGQEVAVCAKGHRPVGLVGDGQRADWAGDGRVARHKAGRGLGTVHLLIQHFDAEVERLGHVPLRTATDAPRRPVVVATGRSGRETAKARSKALIRAQQRIAAASTLTVRHLVIGAVQRSVPSRGPVMLVAGIEAPCGRQLATGLVGVDGRLRVDAVAQDAVGFSGRR